MDGEVVKFPNKSAYPKLVTGSAGLYTQLPGAATTVSNIAGATGGINSGNLIERINK